MHRFWIEMRKDEGGGRIDEEELTPERRESSLGGSEVRPDEQESPRNVEESPQNDPVLCRVVFLRTKLGAFWTIVKLCYRPSCPALALTRLRQPSASAPPRRADTVLGRRVRREPRALRHWLVFVATGSVSS
jgi:hypothetical protein